VTDSHERHTTLLRTRCEAVEVLTGRTNKLAVLVIQQFPVDADIEPLCPPVRESIANIMMFVELGTVAQLESSLAVAASRCGKVAVDCDHKLPESSAIVERARGLVPPERLMLYSDNHAWFDSALDMIQRIEHGVTNRSVMVSGTGALAELFGFTLPRLGARIVRADDLRRSWSAPRRRRRASMNRS
jgi:hypothetical protein